MYDCEKCKQKEASASNQLHSNRAFTCFFDDDGTYNQTFETLAVFSQLGGGTKAQRKHALLDESKTMQQEL